MNTPQSQYHEKNPQDSTREDRTRRFSLKRGRDGATPDEITGRQALNDDTKQAVVMDMCRVELERHLVLHSDRRGMYPKVKSANRDYVKQMRHRFVPRWMSTGEVAYTHCRRRVRR